MKNLVFQITNELLNQSMIVDNARPSQVEEIISTVLKTNGIGAKKVHYLNRLLNRPGQEPLCNQPYTDLGSLNLTEIEADVTCLRCKKSLAKRHLSSEK